VLYQEVYGLQQLVLHPLSVCLQVPLLHLDVTFYKELWGAAPGVPFYRSFVLHLDVSFCKSCVLHLDVSRSAYKSFVLHLDVFTRAYASPVRSVCKSFMLQLDVSA
jgi:hypothetical protein